MSVTRVSKQRLFLGEGPHWSGNHLYLVDIDAGDICKLDPSTGEIDSIHLGGYTSFVIPYSSDSTSLLVSCTNQIKKLNFNTGHSELITQLDHEDPKYRFNDGKCDARGRLWAGTMFHDVVGTSHHKAHLYSMSSDNRLKLVEHGISLSNGIAWNSNNVTMYYIDSDERTIFAYDYNLEDGSASNKRALIDYNKEEGYQDLGLPDGMTIDTENKLWVANFGGGCIIRIDPETRVILRRFDIPSQYVTSCCFGGPNLDILYVTTAAKTEEFRREYPDAGAVFAITGHGSRGLPSNNFNS